MAKMIENRVPYAEAEKCFPLTANRFALLEDADEFPVLDSTVSHSIYTTQRVWETGQSTKTSSNRRKRFEELNNSETLNPEQEPQADLSNENPGKRKEWTNRHKATELESFIHQMRKLLLQHLQSKPWLQPIIQLRDKLQSNIQKERTEAETDLLLIKTCSELNVIINQGSDDYFDQDRRIENRISNGE